MRAPFLWLWIGLALNFVFYKILNKSGRKLKWPVYRNRRKSRFAYPGAIRFKFGIPAEITELAVCYRGIFRQVGSADTLFRLKFINFAVTEIHSGRACRAQFYLPVRL